MGLGRDFGLMGFSPRLILSALTSDSRRGIAISRKPAGASDSVSGSDLKRLPG
jgi:hypothetical protein